MFSRILKKDLKRKKTMNVILLIFVVLSVMFASSSVNNMISVYGGIDYFFEKAGMPDYVMLTLNTEGRNPTDDIIKQAGSVTGYEKEDIIFYNARNLKQDDKTYVSFENPGIITSVKDAKIRYFDRENESIEEVSKGHIYVGGLLSDPGKAAVGDQVTLELGNVRKELYHDILR